MRCLFCGWDKTPEGQENCEKCGRPLSESVSQSDAVDKKHAQHRPTSRQSASADELKKTVREGTVAGSAVEEPAGNVCPSCGYTEYVKGESCPVCGYTDSRESVPSDDEEVLTTEDSERGADSLRKTVRPNRKGEKQATFRLVPIVEGTGEEEGFPISFEGSAVELNRANTDPSNNEITSRVQARVLYKDGRWTVVDCSEFKTTYVQASREMELRDGDYLLLGTQLYRFEA